MNSTEKKWYILYTMPQHEKKVADYFMKRGVEYYLPLISKKRKWSDRIKIVDFPLFPGYIFIKVDLLKDRLTVLEHSGALAFVRKEGMPSHVEEDVIESLRLIVSKSNDVACESDSEFPPGQQIKIRFGPLKGVSGVVISLKNKKRIYVRVPLLNQMVSTEVDIIDLEKEY